MNAFTLAAATLALASVSLSAVHADAIPVTTRPAPALAQGVWINGAPTTIAAQRGKVTVLLFWTHECINCKHNLGYWNDWAKKYKDTDVTVLSVHTPETATERVIGNVRHFVKDRNIQFPVVTDNDEKTWNAYSVQAWPTEILIDKAGNIRYEFNGELNWGGSGEYKTVQGLIEKLRGEKAG
ncbi:hypothetical protein CCAX7_37420 [Capsulimonas corticalis]|uniref:Uncharacterized protein n=1 Tax=Capsulimonas corticalis TaxID=2219043 RepID=A0A402D122_9BACT|nr:redoxin domain-containing protein [Capsulimonas corticalis]BDI31691.1 hypothetical protein CCAX7_37420 [Capsulimonas corticalis]